MPPEALPGQMAAIAGRHWPLAARPRRSPRAPNVPGPAQLPQRSAFSGRPIHSGRHSTGRFARVPRSKECGIVQPSQFDEPFATASMCESSRFASHAHGNGSGSRTGFGQPACASASRRKDRPVAESLSWKELGGSAVGRSRVPRSRTCRQLGPSVYPYRTVWKRMKRNERAPRTLSKLWNRSAWRRKSETARRDLSILPSQSLPTHVRRHAVVAMARSAGCRILRLLARVQRVQRLPSR